VIGASSLIDLLYRMDSGSQATVHDVIGQSALADISINYAVSLGV